MKHEARAFAPASVANVGCGFDCMGFAVEQLGDLVVARRGTTPGVTVEAITGDRGKLPLAAARNTAGKAVQALLHEVGHPPEEPGVALEIHKRMPLSSGLGSSAASAVAAVVAAADLLELDLPRTTLLRCAIRGEAVASGGEHPDNVTPSLYGGFVLVRAMAPLDVIELPVPDGLSCALVRPHVEIETHGARTILGESVALPKAVRQWANVGALVAGLFRSDLDLVGRAIHDEIAEPVRTPLVPGFDAATRAARACGAIGCGLSGSGPTIFALCRDRAGAEVVADAMVEAVAKHAATDCDRLVSVVGARGARVLTDGGAL